MSKNAGKTQAEYKQKRKQSGSADEAKCPYFESAKGKLLICAEGIPIKGTQARTYFTYKKQREKHMNQFCCSEYRCCVLFRSAICVFNEGIECNQKGNCDSCGWNPEVSLARLLKLVDAGINQTNKTPTN